MSAPIHAYEMRQSKPGGGCKAEEGHGGAALSSHRALSSRTYQPGEEAPRFISSFHLRALRPGLSRGISAAVQPCGALRGGTERGGTALLSALRRVGMLRGAGAIGCPWDGAGVGQSSVFFPPPCSVCPPAPSRQ